MSDIVVNKVINFLGKDQLTPTAQKVKQAMDNIKDKNVKLDVTADEQKIVTFNQKLQGLPKDVQTTLKAMAEKNGFDTYESYMRALPKEQYSKLKAIVERNGFEAYQSDLKSLPKSQQTELKTKLDESGFRTFKEWYDKVPKESRTVLDAVANKTPIEDFERVAKGIPKHITTKVSADTTAGSTAMDNFGNHVEAAKEKTSGFKTFLSGTLIGGAVLSGLQAMSAGLVSTAKNGMEVAEAGEQINRVWMGMGLTADQTKGLVGEMGELRSATGFSAGAITDLQKKIYGFTGSFAMTQNLSRAFSSLAVESGKGEDAANGLAASFAKVETSGKLSAMAFTRMSKAAPALPREMAKALGMTQDQLNKAVASGQVTTDKFDYAMTQIAAHSSDTFNSFGKTSEGALARIKSGWISAQGALMAPLVNEKNTGLSDIADELNSSAFKGLLTDAGNGLAKLSQHVASIIQYLSQNKGTVSDIVKDLGTIVGLLVKDVWNVTVEMFSDLAKALGLIGKNSKDDADPLKTLAKLLDAAAKHKTAIKAIATALVAMKAFKMSEAAFAPLLKVAGLADKTKGGLLTKIIGEGDKQKKVFRVPVQFAIDKTAGAAKWLFKKGVVNPVKFVGQWTWTGLKDVGGLIGKGASKAATYTVKAVVSGAGKVRDLALAGKDLAVAFGVKTIGALKTFGTTMMTLGKTALMNPYVDIALAVVGLGVAFYEAYKHIKPFRDAMNKLGGSIIKGVKAGIDGAKKLFTGKLGWEQAIGKETRKIGEHIQSGFKTGTDWVKKHKTEITASIVHPFSGVAAWFLKDTKTGKNVTKWMSGLEKSVKASTKGKKGLGNNLVGAFKGVGDWLLKDKSTKKGFDKWMSGLESSVKNSTKGKKGLLANITGTFKGIAKWFHKDKGTKKAMQKWSNELSGVFSGKNGFAKSFSKSLDSMEKSLKKSKFGKSWDRFWKDTQKTTTTWDKNINKWWSGFSKDFGKKWNQSWKERKTDMHDNWKNMHNAYDDFTTAIGKWWSGFSTSFGKNWNQSWKDRKTDMHDNWKNMHNAYDDFTTGISKWWSSFSSGFKKGWDSVWKGISDTFKTIFGGLKGIAKSAWNGIIGVLNGGIGAINDVIKLFGGKSLGTLKTLETGSNYHPGGFAKINDAKSSVYREIVKLPNGHMFSPTQRNVVLPLPQGSSVLPAQASRKYVESGLIPRYENGIGDTLSNFFDSATKGISNVAGDVGSWVSSKIKEIGGDIEKGIKFAKDFISDPIGNLTKAFDSVTDGKFAKEEFSSKMGPATGLGIVKAIADKVKSMALDFKKSLEEVTVSGKAMPATAYGPMIKAAAAFMHQSITDFNVDMIERIIANESGGDPNATNNWDGNARAGHPSTGILQYIMPTFMNYAMPGHTNIHSPFDQLIALFNDATWRSDMGMGYNGKYGEWRGQASGPSGPRLMANGAHVFSATNAIMGEDGDEFAINPSKPSAIPLIADLMGRMADYHPEFRTSNLTSNISADLGQKLDTVISLLGSINNKNFAPEVNIARTSSNFNQQNRRDTDIYAYQRGMRQ